MLEGKKITMKCFLLMLQKYTYIYINLASEFFLFIGDNNLSPQQHIV